MIDENLQYFEYTCHEHEHVEPTFRVGVPRRSILNADRFAGPLAVTACLKDIQHWHSPKGRSQSLPVRQDCPTFFLDRLRKTARQCTLERMLRGAVPTEVVDPKYPEPFYGLTLNVSRAPCASGELNAAELGITTQIELPQLNNPPEWTDIASYVTVTRFSPRPGLGVVTEVNEDPDPFDQNTWQLTTLALRVIWPPVQDRSWVTDPDPFLTLAEWLLPPPTTLTPPGIASEYRH